MLSLTFICLTLLFTTTLASSAPAVCTLGTPTNIAPGTLTAENGCAYYHEVVKGDSCLDILNYYPGALSLAAFHAANPSVDSKCFNLQPGTAVCVSGPVNVAPGSFTLDNGCTKFRKVNKGDTCESIVKSIGDITLADFYRFNSKVDIKCSNLPINLQVCTCDGGKGKPDTPAPSPRPTTTMPGHDDECEEEPEEEACEEEDDDTAPTFTVSRAVPTSTVSNMPSSPVAPPPPTAGCDSLLIVAAGDTCASIALAYGSTTEAVAALNPGLKCDALVAGSSICVGAGLPLASVSVEPLRRHRRAGGIKHLR